ncbi:Gfo/Idh/MocA family oxidoreductase [Erysipelothrix sp. HDW6C]|uniref:Gfo/Idh/MocA family protein n=1 Tax=Erysipelothrix sp. HDW6C TaxID=2714930 RepID=UPI001408CD53|nr:Gfo/Idh/MocA family oxidoreductase [Erysipelothrix sp. HDW6C]QIK68990.1 Gfo/Idh/MocA family oxidoreductase [Erysipelothrix sp. HDW6C]
MKQHKTMKAAIVGTGFIGKQHYEAIRRLPNTGVVAVVDADATKIAAFAQEYGIEHAFTSMEELLDNLEIDVVHICTPNFLHYPMAKLALERGVNVFCEKPLSLTAHESEDLVRIAKDKQVHHAVNLNYRSNVMVREMRHRIQNEQIGNVLMIQSEYIQDWLMFDTDYDWHFLPKMVGPSRTVADIGTHVFDIVQFVTNSKIKEVFANLVTVYPQRFQREQRGETFSQEYVGEAKAVDVVNEDAAMIIARLDNGAQVSIVLSQVTGGYKNGLEIVVSGSKSSLTWKQEMADRLIVGNRLGGNEMLYADPKYVDRSLSDFISLPNGHAVGWADAFKNSIHEFYKTIQNDVYQSDSIVDFNEGHYLMKLVEATLESNKTKQWVTIHE